MVFTWGIQLADHVISTFYGDLCAKVCGCLLRGGALSMINIIRKTEISKENVSNCLRVLIHQNCVQAFSIQEEGAFGEAPKIITQYMAVFDNIIHKLRAIKFNEIVSEELGEDCLGIFQGLIEHGRQSFGQIIDRVEHKTGNVDVQVVKNNFRKLLSAHFIERCPVPEPFLAPPTEEETSTKKRGSKAVKIAEQSIEQRAFAAAAPMESLRFLMEMDDISEVKDKETGTPKVGNKRKQDVLNPDEDALDGNRKKEVLWRVNSEEFVWRLIHKACISFVKTAFNNEASIVLSAILDLSRQSETQLKAEKSPYMSINDIYDEVIKKDGVGMDLKSVSSSLDELGCQTLNESYSADIKSIMQKARNSEVESVVAKRYGREAKRIFRKLLTTDHFAETDKIADTTFVEKTETVKILYKLWKDGYVHMEKVTTSGARQQSTFYLWKIEHNRLWERFLDEMYHCFLNLRMRTIFEKDRRKEVIQILESSNFNQLPQEIKQQMATYKIVRTTFERSMLNLNDAILICQNL